MHGDLFSDHVQTLWIFWTGFGEEPEKETSWKVLAEGHMLLIQ